MSDRGPRNPEARGGGAAVRSGTIHVVGGPFALLAQARAELGRGQEWRRRRLWPEQGPPTALPVGAPSIPVSKSLGTDSSQGHTSSMPGFKDT